MTPHLRATLRAFVQGAVVVVVVGLVVIAMLDRYGE